MDPNQAYLDMFEAMKANDFETARELALALKNWFAKGGFYPYQFTPEAMHAYLASVLRRTAGHGPEPPFSLVCRHCDAGGEIETEEQAIGEGWSEIEPAFALPQANFCGLCPDCKTLED
ncbi:MAG: hypothetical protein KDA96_22170 [Planctomycetaceae bacterium]|nr:hypothetical protein [Planctomycetaceae bacterium]